MAEVYTRKGWIEMVRTVFESSKPRREQIAQILNMTNKAIKAKPNDKAYAEKALQTFIKTSNKIGLAGQEEVIVPDFKIVDNKIEGKFVLKTDDASIDKGYDAYLASKGLKLVKK